MEAELESVKSKIVEKEGQIVEKEAELGRLPAGDLERVPLRGELAGLRGELAALREKENICLNQAHGGMVLDQSMSDALAAMRTSQRVAAACGTVELPASYLPGDAYQRRQLYVRACYHTLFDIIAKHRAALLIGTPGIGKSWFLLYIIWRLQQEDTPPVIVWEPRTRPGMCLLKDGKAYWGSINDCEAELKDAQTWYLVDGHEPSNLQAIARVVLASSPRSTTYKEFNKQYTACELVMPLWSPEEIKELYTDAYHKEGLDWGRVQSLVERYGPVPRFVLEKPLQQGAASLEQDLKELDKALAGVDVDQMVKSTSNLDVVPERYHRLLHLEAGADFNLQRIKFASKHVGDHITNMLAKRPQEQLWSILDALGEKSAWRTVKGVVFEQYCHQVLSAGGTFTVRELGQGLGSPDSGPGFSFGSPDSAARTWQLTLQRSEASYFSAAVTAGAASSSSSSSGGRPEMRSSSQDSEAGTSSSSSSSSSSTGRSHASAPGTGNNELLTAAENRAVQQVASALAEVKWDDSMPSMYLMPSSPTFPGVDAILLPSMLLQMTVSGKREYPGAIIPALLDVLPEGRQCYLIYCVDDQCKFSVAGLPAGPLGKRQQQLRVLSLDLARQSQDAGLLGRARLPPASAEPPHKYPRHG